MPLFHVFKADGIIPSKTLSRQAVFLHQQAERTCAKLVLTEKNIDTMQNTAVCLQKHRKNCFENPVLLICEPNEPT